MACGSLQASKAADSINTRLALVITSGKYQLGSLGNWYTIPYVIAIGYIRSCVTHINWIFHMVVHPQAVLMAFHACCRCLLLNNMRNKWQLQSNNVNFHCICIYIYIYVSVFVILSIVYQIGYWIRGQIYRWPTEIAIGPYGSLLPIPYLLLLVEVCRPPRPRLHQHALGAGD